MSFEDWVLRQGSASEEAIRGHLLACDFDFVPSLASRVDIGEYAGKLCRHAVTFEAWAGDRLVALVAAYFDRQPETRKVFVSNVSVLRDFASRGIATRLMQDCIAKATAEGAEMVELEVFHGHDQALKFYSKLGFKRSGGKGDTVQLKLQLAKSG